MCVCVCVCVKSVTFLVLQKNKRKLGSFVVPDLLILIELVYKFNADPETRVHLWKDKDKKEKEKRGQMLVNNVTQRVYIY